MATDGRGLGLGETEYPNFEGDDTPSGGYGNYFIGTARALVPTSSVLLQSRDDAPGLEAAYEGLGSSCEAVDVEAEALRELLEAEQALADAAAQEDADADAAPSSLPFSSSAASALARARELLESDDPPGFDGPLAGGLDDTVVLPGSSELQVFDIATARRSGQEAALSRDPFAPISESSPLTGGARTSADLFGSFDGAFRDPEDSFAPAFVDPFADPFKGDAGSFHPSSRNGAAPQSAGAAGLGAAETGRGAPAINCAFRDPEDSFGPAFVDPFADPSRGDAGSSYPSADPAARKPATPELFAGDRSVGRDDSSAAAALMDSLAQEAANSDASAHFKTMGNAGGANSVFGDPFEQKATTLVSDAFVDDELVDAAGQPAGADPFARGRMCGGPADPFAVNDDAGGADHPRDSLRDESTPSYDPFALPSSPSKSSYRPPQPSLLAHALQPPALGDDNPFRISSPATTFVKASTEQQLKRDDPFLTPAGSPLEPRREPHCEKIASQDPFARGSAPFSALADPNCDAYGTDGRFSDRPDDEPFFAPVDSFPSPSDPLRQTDPVRPAFRPPHDPLASSASYFAAQPQRSDPIRRMEAVWEDELAPGGYPAPGTPAAFPTPARRPSAQSSSGPQLGLPFAESVETAVQRKLAGHEAEVQQLGTAVAAIMCGESSRLVELRQVVQEADELQTKLMLHTEQQLALAGWPSEPLHIVRHTLLCVDQWGQCLDAAREQVVASDVSAVFVVQLLHQLVGAWVALTASGDKPKGVDLGLASRGRSASPLVAALVDRAMTEAQEKDDKHALSQIASLLSNAKVSKVLREDLGAALPTPSTMRDLTAVRPPARSVAAEPEPAPVAPAAPAAGPAAVSAGSGVGVPAPDAFIEAISSKDARAVDAMLKQGVVQSGRDYDSRGHSIFWHAVVRQVLDVALSILIRFPPQAADGVDLNELHAARGDSLLHLLSVTEKFDRRAAELFLIVIGGVSDATRRCTNSLGQTFLHAASARLNFWVLSHSVPGHPNLAPILTRADTAGWTPLGVLSRHAKDRGVVWPTAPPPLTPDSSVRASAAGIGSATPAGWFHFGPLRPNAGGSRPAFSDLDIEIEDEASPGSTVRFAAHRVVIAAASPSWHEALRKMGALGPMGGGAPAVLRLPKDVCANPLVLEEVLAWVYSGSFRNGLEGDARALWQLLCLVVPCRLPEALRRQAATALCQALRRPDNAMALPVVLRAAKRAMLSESERRFVLGRLLCAHPEALLCGGDEKAAGKSARALFDELEAVMAAACATPSGAGSRGATRAVS